MSFFQSSDRQREYAITFLRIILGVFFVAHGAQKLFTFGLPGITAGFTQMGIPLPGITAPLVSGLEFFGGIALIAGFLTKLTSLGLVIDMLGAMTFVHFKKGFFLPQGYEFVLLLAVASAALAVGGPVKFSIDDLIARRSNEKRALDT